MSIKEKALEDLEAEMIDRLSLVYDRGYHQGLLDQQESIVSWLRAQRGREVSPARLANEILQFEPDSIDGLLSP